MVRAMKELNGMGLAANQIGFDERMFVYQIHDQADAIAVINPQIIRYGLPKLKVSEGCLSIPGIEFLVTRYTSVTLRAQDLSGHWFTIKAREQLAQVFQHEVDHLNGIRCVDRLPNAEKKRALKAMKANLTT